MSVVVLELGLGEAAKSFQLEKAVCSHGFFMMPPNQWDPLSKSLLRPLRLDTTDSDSDSDSVLVRISQHSWAPQISPCQRPLPLRAHSTTSTLTADSGVTNAAFV
jgi:hypothetical protein